MLSTRPLWPAPLALEFVQLATALQRSLRACESTGVWSSTITNRCLAGVTPPAPTAAPPAPATTPTILSCAPSTFDHATYTYTAHGTTGTGVCFLGYQSASSPTRACSSTGVWSSTIHDGCTVIKCASLGSRIVSGETVTFPATTTSPGDRAVGKCQLG